LVANVIDYLQLTHEARAEVLPAGDSRAESRAGWALSFLTRAGALARPGRGEYIITDVGRELLARHPHQLHEQNLRELPGWRGIGHRQITAGDPGPAGDVGGAGTLDAAVQDAAVRSAGRPTDTPSAPITPKPAAGATLPGPGADPHENIQAGVVTLNEAVATELQHRLRAIDTAALERAVIDLLVAMGYGGPRGRTAQLAVTDAGAVAGVVEHDPLGLENIYVQATPGAADAVATTAQLQGFVGALHGSAADRGIFITTSQISPEAVAYAKSIGRVVLIDGTELAELLIRYRVGVREKHTYTVLEIDEVYFE
jgi:restriction system protein